jgi:hypothetical protein
MMKKTHLPALRPLRALQPLAERLRRLVRCPSATDAPRYIRTTDRLERSFG